MNRRSRRSQRGAATAAILAVMLATVAAPAALADEWTFVQDQRVNSLTMQFETDAFATQNALGQAFAGTTIRTMIQSGFASSVADGSTSLMLEMPDLTDLSGTSDPSFHLGVFNPVPAAPGAGNPASYDGTAGLDWWYRPSASELASDGSAVEQLPASFSAKVLNAGPGTMTLHTVLGGVPAALRMSSTRMTAVAGESSAPLRSGNGLPPGHRPEELLPASLTSFETMGSGRLAGRVSARSLALTPIPTGVIGTTCSESYTAAHSMLDLVVSGCHTLGFIAQVRATQPDTIDDTVGDGAYRLIADVNRHVVGCRHDGVDAPLSDCLDGSAYSASFQFTSNRVIDVLTVTTPRQLTVTTAGSGSGSVASIGTGIDCGTDCTERFADGTPVTLAAVPSPGSRFDGWTGCDNPAGATCEVTMDADKVVSAGFVAQRTLTVATAGPGAGRVTSAPHGIDCGTDCSEAYDDGADVTLTPAAATGSVFTGWSGACTGLGSCTLDMTGNRAVGAAFAVVPRPVASADIALTSTGPASARRSAQVTYQVTVVNAGPDAAHNVVLTDRVSSSAKLLGAVASSGSCAKPAKGTVRCTLGNMASGATVRIVVTVKVGAKVGATVSQLASGASVGDGRGAGTVDPDPSNNGASLTTVVAK